MGAVTTAQKAEAKATHQSLSIGLFIGLYFTTQKFDLFSSLFSLSAKKQTKAKVG